MKSHLLILQKHVGEVAVIHPLQRLGRNVSNIAFIVDVLTLDYPCGSMVSDKMLPQVKTFGPLVGHQVTGHVHGFLVVYANKDG